MKISMNFPDTIWESLQKAIELVATVTNTEIEVTLLPPDPIPVPVVEAPKGKPKVQYRAIADASVLAGLGTGWDGVVFKYLLEHGPCTEREIRDARKMKRKASESALDRLKAAHVIRAEKYGTGEPIPVTKAKR